MKPEICPTCGSPIVPPVPELTPIKQRILDTVKRRPGVSAEELARSFGTIPPAGRNAGTRFSFTSRN